jgi:hypothetical protein
LSSGTPNSLLIRLVNSLSVKPRRITLGAPGDGAPLVALADDNHLDRLTTTILAG